MRRALIATTITLTVFAALVAIPQSQAGAQPQQTQRPTPAARPHRDPCRPADAPCWRNHINRRIWMAELARQQRYARLLAYAAAVAASQCRGYGCVQGIRVCDAWPGDFPCKIINRESRFDPNAYNRSGAYGLAQMKPGWWAKCRLPARGVAVADQVRCYRWVWHTYGSWPWRL